MTNENLLKVISKLLQYSFRDVMHPEHGGFSELTTEEKTIIGSEETFDVLLAFIDNPYRILWREGDSNDKC